jgi:diadenosine tetraphosphate (Ap4A) HIT family hydrolase
MHVHFHIIPKYSEGDGLEIGWNTQPLDQVDAVQLAASIAQELRT